MPSIDAVSYFTDGLCTPVSNLNAVAYFTNGLVVPATAGKQDSGPTMSRNKLRRIREDKEILMIIQTFLDEVID